MRSRAVAIVILLCLTRIAMSQSQCSPPGSNSIKNHDSEPKALQVYKHLGADGARIEGVICSFGASSKAGAWSLLTPGRKLTDVYSMGRGSEAKGDCLRVLQSTEVIGCLLVLTHPTAQ